MAPGYIAARNFQMRAQGLQAASDSLDTVSTESWRPQSACLSVWHVVVLRNKFTIRLSLQKREFQKSWFGAVSTTQQRATTLGELNHVNNRIATLRLFMT